MDELVNPSEGIFVENFELELNTSAKGFLMEAVKWAYFLSILGYVFIGIILLMAVFSGAIFAFIGNLNSEMHNVGLFGGSFFIAIYLIIAIFYFIPIYYLNRFAANAKVAFKNKDSEALANSFEFLKSHYKYIGIIAIITICFYGLIILGILIFAITVGLNL
jgi:hypothetical protein